MQDLTVFIAHHMGLTYAFAALFVALMIIEFLRAKRNNLRVDTTQAVQLINRQNAVVIDVRTKDIFRTGHIIDAIQINGSDLQTNNKKIERYRAKPIILVCENGNESQKIAALLLKQGYNAYSLSGGLRAWTEAELPLVKE